MKPKNSDGNILDLVMKQRNAAFPRIMRENDASDPDWFGCAGWTWRKIFLGTTYASVVIATCLMLMCRQAVASTPLPDDLKFVPADSLPTHASWFSIQRWGKYPPSPCNWCAGRDDVFYYRSASFGTNRNLFTNYVGDVLVEQAGENGAVPELFIVHWNSITTNFESHGILLRDFFNNGDFLEKSTFAPINMPAVQ